MRIITLRAENVKRLRAVEVTPEGDVVVIAGRNAQGKSSVLDAIWMALAGGAGSKETSRPIRDGEEKASVSLDLGDLVVTRKWTKAGSTLEVSAQDGARYSSPQTILDGLIGKLSFDPLEFAEQDSKAQLRTLLDVVDLPFDPVHLDMQRKGVFDDRTEINREVKRLEAQVAGVPAVPGDTPDEEVSASSIAEKLEDAVADAKNRQSLRVAIVEEEGKVSQLRVALAAAAAEVARLRRIEVDVSEPVDPEPLRQQLADLDETNANVRANQQRRALAKALSKAKEDADRLTNELVAIDTKKATALLQVKMPLEGLSFDEEGVLYNGIPFSQSSSAERLRVGIAMAMALNPKIRVIRITDGSLLDSENLAMIAEMAGENDFQVWLEKVDETGKVGITIEDGQVVEVAT